MPITQLSQLDLNKTYTVLDYLSWQMEEMVELIKGKIYKMSPSPKSSHQLIVTNFIFSLRLLKKQYKHSCKVCVSPFDVYLKGIGEDKTTVVQPDICIVCDIIKIEERGCLGAPDLIVEILSPSTLTKDVNIKYHLYQENGVNEYWIV